jgi:hypothetical protein
MSSLLRDGPAALALDGRTVAGFVVNASVELGCFHFLPEDADAPPEVGDRVRLRFGASGSFDAIAELIEVEDDDRWVFAVPAPLDPSLRRRDTRLRADGEWSFQVEDGDEVDVYDISARGVGLLFPRGEGPKGRGAVLRGTLLRDGGRAWKAELTCTNVRPCAEADHLWIVGARMQLGSEAERAALDALIERLL